MMQRTRRPAILLYLAGPTTDNTASGYCVNERRLSTWAVSWWYRTLVNAELPGNSGSANALRV
jgi:hypothetical protein